MGYSIGIGLCLEGNTGQHSLDRQVVVSTARVCLWEDFFQGHSYASVTTDIYGHVMAHSQGAAAENIEEIMKPLTNVLR